MGLFYSIESFLLTSTVVRIRRTHIQPVEEYERKSVGTESTFRDLSGSKNLREKLRYTAEELEKDLISTQFTGRTLTLKVKLHDYQVFTRQRKLDRAIQKVDDLYNLALPLLQGLEAEFKPLKIRLMGLRVNQLVSMKKGAIDTNKWFFGKLGSSPKKRKVDLLKDGGEWEVWPEEEFEQAHADEKIEDRKLAEEAAREDAKNEDHNPSAGEDDSPTMWDCPICTRPQPADDALFNQHVDYCLSKQAIRQAVQQSSASLSQPPVPGTKRVKVSNDKQKCTQRGLFFRPKSEGVSKE